MCVTVTKKSRVFSSFRFQPNSTPSHFRRTDSLNTRRPSTTTTTTTMDVQLNQNTVSTDKISAYYSLVFPTITYYLQTPNVTIGRRCIPPNSPSSSTAAPQIDIDLGSLKSVSRLHANIEYDEAEDRWVLVVHGRNGAWVDGVWIQPGKRAPLNERRVILPLHVPLFANENVSPIGPRFKLLREPFSSSCPLHQIPLL